MSIFRTSLRVGEAVQIGPDVVVRVEQKTGQFVSLAIAAMLHIAPIEIIPSGIIPARFTTGVTGQRKAAATEMGSRATGG